MCHDLDILIPKQWKALQARDIAKPYATRCKEDFVVHPTLVAAFLLQQLPGQALASAKLLQAPKYSTVFGGLQLLCRS